MSNTQEIDLLAEYSVLYKRQQEKPSGPGKTDLASLTDRELFVFIAVKTMDYGRSFHDSIENAITHMKTRSHAEELFSNELTDCFGAV